MKKNNTLLKLGIAAGIGMIIISNMNNSMSEKSFFKRVGKKVALNSKGLLTIIDESGLSDEDLKRLRKELHHKNKQLKHMPVKGHHHGDHNKNNNPSLMDAINLFR